MINNLQLDHALVILVADNLTTYVDQVRHNPPKVSAALFKCYAHSKNPMLRSFKYSYRVSSLFVLIYTANESLKGLETSESSAVAALPDSFSCSICFERLIETF